MIILNDIHVGFDRKGGTTPTSREALRTYLMGRLAAFIDRAIDDYYGNDDHLVILGDLFDHFEVASRDWVETFTILQAWLQGGGTLTLVAGNHDHSPRALKVSSFEALCQVLKSIYPATVQVIAIDEWAYLNNNVVALAHCANQDTFDLKLKELLGKMGKGHHLFLHANYDNKFAVESDHSLNVSEDVARRFAEIGVRLYFAHEHQARAMRGGQVRIFGNQWPTSIADCLSNDQKFAHRLHDDGTLEEILTWSRDDDTASYAEVDWRELTGTSAKFIRVGGEAASSEASEVINAIAKFRQSSSAFIVTNAVKVEGMVAVEELPETFEAAKAFDVMEFIAKHMDPEEMKIVKELAGSN